VQWLITRNISHWMSMSPRPRLDLLKYLTAHVIWAFTRINVIVLEILSKYLISIEYFYHLKHHCRGKPKLNSFYLYLIHR
jgi:hypothetical protein